jgi:hypothetical protein
MLRLILDQFSCAYRQRNIGYRRIPYHYALRIYIIAAPTPRAPHQTNKSEPQEKDRDACVELLLCFHVVNRSTR